MGASESVASYFYITNHTNVNCTTSVTSVRSYDFNGKDRPSKNFQGITIPAGKTVYRRLELTQHATNSPFTITLYFKDNTRDSVKVNQKWALDESDYRMDYKFKPSHQLTLTRDVSEPSMTLTVELTPGQKRHLAEINQLNVGFVDVWNNNYIAAIQKFQDLLNKTKDQYIKQRAQEGLRQANIGYNNKIARELNNEAIQLLRKNLFLAAIQKSEQALKYARTQEITRQINQTLNNAKNKLAENLIKQAIGEIKRQQFNTANAKLKEALKWANQTKTRQDAEKLISRVNVEIGISLYEKAWSLEQDTTKDNTSEAEKCFNEAKKSLELALNQSSSAEEYLQKVNKKIEANTLFNKAIDLEEMAFQQFERARNEALFKYYLNSEKTYLDTIKSYTEAKSLFYEGLALGEERCKQCGVLAAQQVDAVNDVLDDFVKIKLIHAINNLQLNTKHSRYNNTKKSEAEVLEMFYQILN